MKVSPEMHEVRTKHIRESGKACQSSCSPERRLEMEPYRVFPENGPNLSISHHPREPISAPCASRTSQDLQMPLPTATPSRIHAPRQASFC